MSFLKHNGNAISKIDLTHITDSKQLLMHVWIKVDSITNETSYIYDQNASSRCYLRLNSIETSTGRKAIFSFYARSFDRTDIADIVGAFYIDKSSEFVAVDIFIDTNTGLANMYVNLDLSKSVISKLNEDIFHQSTLASIGMRTDGFKHVADGTIIDQLYYSNVIPSEYLDANGYITHKFMRDFYDFDDENNLKIKRESLQLVGSPSFLFEGWHEKFSTEKITGKIAEITDILYKNNYKDNIKKFEGSDLLAFTQDRPSYLDFEKHGIKNDFAYSSGSFFNAPKDRTIQEFLAILDSTLISDVNLMDEQRRVRDTNTHLLLDIEFALQSDKFAGYIADENIDHIEVFRKIKVMIDEVKRLFPNKIIGIYGYMLPNGSSTFDSLEPQAASIRTAAATGMLDNVDVLWSVVYLRFGPTDSNYNKIIPQTDASIRKAKTIFKSNGEEFKVGALYSQRVINSDSVTNHKNEILTQPVIEQRQLVKNYDFDVFEGVWDSDCVKAGFKWFKGVSN